MTLTDDLLYFWLSICGVKPYKQKSLLKELSIREIFDRTGKDKKLEESVGENTYKEMKLFKNEAIIEKALENMYESGIKYITINDKRFPKRLNQTSVNPSPLLYYKGDVSLLDTACVAMVGTRTCSRYGKETAEMLAKGLCEYGITVVSGLATGIDYYSHLSAIENNGKTIAVLGSGINKASPAANLALFKQITEKGLAVSEYPVNMEASKYTFPERNRIISGLSSAVIVVEASAKSGSLITANYALEQDRELFAVPGNITNPKSEGTNNLLKEKARPITSVKDILEFLNYQHTKINKVSTSIQLDIYEEKIYNLLKNGEMHIEELIEKANFTLQETLNILFSLEMKNLIKRIHNNTYKIEREI